MERIKPHPMCVKIMFYKGFHVDKVVYYRNKIPMHVLEHWRWYFEYIAARIKVKHPRNKVELIICPQTLLQGEEYRQKKIKDLLRNKRGRLKKLLDTPAEKDLFSLNEEERQEKIKKLEQSIKRLEAGHYEGWVPPTYMNYIKDYI